MADSPLPEKRETTGLTGWPEAFRWMEARAAAIADGTAAEAVWLLEHPPLYTAGTSASPEELLGPTTQGARRKSARSEFACAAG